MGTGAFIRLPHIHQRGAAIPQQRGGLVGGDHLQGHDGILEREWRQHYIRCHLFSVFLR